MAKKKRNLEEPVIIDLPITPMLDMAFQLLAFFVLTFHPPSAEGQIPMRLPKLDNPPGQPSMPEETLPADQEDVYKLQVYSSNGAISRVTLVKPLETLEFPFAGGTTTEDLRIALKDIPKKGGEKPASLQIESDSDLKFSGLITLMDTARKAGFDAIGVSERKKVEAKAMKDANEPKDPAD
jgi:biopolymer transport protein ExbD